MKVLTIWPGMYPKLDKSGKIVSAPYVDIKIQESGNVHGQKDIEPEMKAAAICHQHSYGRQEECNLKGRFSVL